MPNTTWTNATSQQRAYRRAGGRRRYNATRQFMATVRLGMLVKIIKELDFCWGWQSEAARRLGVNRSTICRDHRKLQKLCKTRDVVIEGNAAKRELSPEWLSLSELFQSELQALQFYGISKGSTESADFPPKQQHSPAPACSATQAEPDVLEPKPRRFSSKFRGLIP